MQGAGKKLFAALSLFLEFTSTFPSSPHRIPISVDTSHLYTLFHPHTRSLLESFYITICVLLLSSSSSLRLLLESAPLIPLSEPMTVAMPPAAMQGKSLPRSRWPCTPLNLFMLSAMPVAETSSSTRRAKSRSTLRCPLVSGTTKADRRVSPRDQVGPDSI